MEPRAAARGWVEHQPEAGRRTAEVAAGQGFGVTDGGCTAGGNRTGEAA